MSSKRSSKPPPRPPPPRGGLSLGLGDMSFKKLEQGHEEEEEDITISDKYTGFVQQARVTSAASASASACAPLLESIGTRSLSSSALTASKADSAIPEKEGHVSSSSQKKGSKSVFEYKEILSGLKGKIQEKITKTIEDFSGDSNTSDNPDKEQMLSAASSQKSDTSTSSKDSQMDPVMEATATRFQPSSFEIRVKPNPPITRSTRTGSEEKQDTEDTNGCSSQPSQPSCSAADDVKEVESVTLSAGQITPEPAEDFSGSLTSSTTLRFRSTVKGQKETPNTVGIVDHTAAGRTAGAEGDSHEQTDKQSSSSDHDTCTSPQTARSAICLITGNCLPTLRSKVLALMSCLFIFFILPMPSYLSGLIMGCVLTSLWLAAYTWIMHPPRVKDPSTLTPLEDLPPMEIPEMKEATLIDGIYKGWMNEIKNYNLSEYHINQTSSVFVTLEGTKLRLQRPKNSVPKRAMHDENLNTAHFIHQRHFELTGSRVLLQPPELVKKRMWSKKYPICLALAEVGTKTKSVSDVPEDQTMDDNSGSEPGFELTSEEKCDSSVLFLFARTGKEKEEWYRRFVAATQGKPLANAVLEMRRSIELHRQSHQKRINSDSLPLQRHNSTDSQSSTTSDSAENTAAEMEGVDPVLEFTRYMGHLMPANTFTHLLSPAKNSKDSGAVPRSPFRGSIICDNQLYWLNALIGRCFFDFLRDAWWADKVKDKLQRKLSKIHVPYFIEELQVTAIDLGKEMPVVRRASKLYLDERGFWTELDVSYGGGFTMTIETKINLMKLKRSSTEQTRPMTTPSSERSPVTDSEEEDSAESSTDEEEEAVAGPEEKESGSKKLLKYLNKLTSSKYFQQATEYKYIKRAMENVSNTPLQLQVSVKNLVGKLAVNIPPAPTDRLWYGFRGPPRLSLVAKPQVGERVVTITHITDWIERKLELEFQRVFVMPNMDDLVIPILRPSLSENSTPGNHSRSPSQASGSSTCVPALD